MRLFLLLLAVPVIEIALFIEVGGWIGTWPTIAIVILTALAGSVLLRHQGMAAMQGFQARLAAGETPGRLLADGAMILVAGVLLLTPGFFTDAVGFALLVPPVRAALWHWGSARFDMTKGAAASFHFETPPGGGGVRGGPTVDGEYSELHPDEAEPDRERPDPSSVPRLDRDGR